MFNRNISKAPYWVECSVLAGALFALLLINLQLWGFETPPLIDWPNHLVRHALQCAAPGAEFIGQYYEYNLRIVPNLTSDLIHTLDIACWNIEITQKVLIQVSSFGIVLATVVLNWAIWRRLSIWPIISGLIMHHMAWSWGFENFILAVPITLFILAVWFVLANRNQVIRLLALWPLAVGLYVLHLYAFAFLFLVIVLLELEKLWTKKTTGIEWRSIILTSCLLILIAVFPTIHLLSALQTSNGVSVSTFAHGGLSTLFKTLISPFIGFGDKIRPNASLIIVVVCVTTFLLTIRWMHSNNRKIILDPRVKRIIPVLLFVALIAPINLAGVYFSNIRFPVLCAALIIAGTRVELSTKALLAFTSTILIVVGIKTSWIVSNWQVHDQQVAELRSVADFLEPTDRLLVFKDGNSSTTTLHFHSTSYILRDQGVYWWGMFTGGNSLSPRAEYAIRDHTQPAPLPLHILDAKNRENPIFDEGSPLHIWPEFYTHALLMFDPEDDRPNVSALGNVHVSGSFFDIYRLEPVAEDIRP